MSVSFGFISENQELIILALLVAVVILALISAYSYLEISKLKKKSKILFSGKNASDLEGIILSQIEKSKELESAITSLKDADQRILDTLSRAVQKVGIIRFNPFGDVGGNQSFTVALLDNHNSGVIILSLYSRDGVRIYGKAILEGKCEYQLSKEEEDVLQMAMKR